MTLETIFSLIVSLATPLAASFLILTSIRYLFSSKEKQYSKAKEKLTTIIKSSVTNEKKFDLELINHIKHSIERDYVTDVSIVHILQDVIVDLNEKNGDKKDTNIDTLNEYLKELIEEETKAAPFENLPEEERRLFRNIDTALKNEDSSSVRYNLSELSNVLAVRHQKYDRSEKLNKWSKPLAIVGLALTVIFGVTGILAPYLISSPVSPQAQKSKMKKSK